MSEKIEEKENKILIDLLEKKSLSQEEAKLLMELSLKVDARKDDETRRKMVLAREKKQRLNIHAKLGFGGNPPEPHKEQLGKEWKSEQKRLDEEKPK